MTEKPPEKRILNINPDLFSFSNNTTRKKEKKEKDANGGGRIKIRDGIVKNTNKNNESLKKKSILKMIRQHQQDRYNKLLENDKNTSVSSNKDNIDIENYNQDFKEAHSFLEKLVEKKEQDEKIKNYTLKNYPNKSENEILFHPSHNPLNPVLQPNYGCLKNGSLPTYRNYMQTIANKTRKANTMPIVSNPFIHLNHSGGSTMSINNNNSNSNKPNMNFQKPILHVSNHHAVGGTNIPQKIMTSIDNTSIMEKKIDDSLKKISNMKQTSEKLQELKQQQLNEQNKNKKSRMKQKKIKRRTYKIGKSKIQPKVSVLVSNRTIRNNITTKKNSLKQTTMNEVRSFLIKKGFIKVGTTAPNDVLRKMYESAILICGDVQNHNPDNLLYNFINYNENQ